MPQFDISTYPSQLFWLAVVFGALYLITSIFIAPATEYILKNREGFIEDNINSAGSLSEEVKNLKNYYDEELKKVTDKIEHIRAEALHLLAESFEIKTIKLHKELHEEDIKVQNEIDTAIKEFAVTKKETSIEIAGFIIKHIIGQDASKKLLESCYNKVNKV